jgi:hypothetical protein
MSLQTMTRIRLVATVLTCLTGIATAEVAAGGPHANNGLGPPVWIDDSGEWQIAPRIAVSATGRPAVVFTDHRDGIPRTYFSTSSTGNTRWHTTRVDPTNSFQTSSDLDFSPDERVFVIWDDLRDGVPQIYLCLSRKGMHGFQPAHAVHATASMQTQPRIAIDAEGAIHVIWLDWLTGRPDIYYGRSTDKGATFTVQVVATGRWRRESPALGVSPEGDPFVAWLDYRSGDPHPYVRRSTDHGLTFEPALQIYAESSQSDLDIAVGGDGVCHLVWRDLGVCYMRSDDTGTSYPVENFRRPPTEGEGTSQLSPRVTADHLGHVTIVWIDQGAGREPPDLFGSSSDDNGNVFRDAFPVLSGPAEQLSPALVAEPSGNIHFAWRDDGHWPTIRYRRTLF